MGNIPVTQQWQCCVQPAEPTKHRSAEAPSEDVAAELRFDFRVGKSWHEQITLQLGQVAVQRTDHGRVSRRGVQLIVRRYRIELVEVGWLCAVPRLPPGPMQATEERGCRRRPRSPLGTNCTTSETFLQALPLLAHRGEGGAGGSSEGQLRRAASDQSAGLPLSARENGAPDMR